MKYELFLMTNKIRHKKERIIVRDHVSRQLVMLLRLLEVSRNLTYEQFDDKCIQAYILYCDHKNQPRVRLFQKIFNLTFIIY
jgi:hypothetical protein